MRNIEIPKLSLVIDTICVLLREANRTRSMLGSDIPGDHPSMMYAAKLERFAWEWSKHIPYHIREGIWDDYEKRKGLYSA